MSAAAYLDSPIALIPHKMLIGESRFLIAPENDEKSPVELRMTIALDAARAACDQRDYPEAIRLLELHLERDRDDGRGWELLGITLQAVAEYDRSVQALERASALVPLFPSARIAIAVGYGKIERASLSRDLLLELIDDPDMTPEQLLDVATGLDLVDSPHLALRACRQAIANDPDSGQPYYALGYFASRCGYPSHYFVSLARKAISIEPRNTTFRVGLASLLQKLSRQPEAYEVIKDLSDVEIEGIACQCCIERIHQVYDGAGDVRRAALCRQRQFLSGTTQNGSAAD